MPEQSAEDISLLAEGSHNTGPASVSELPHSVLRNLCLNPSSSFTEKPQKVVAFAEFVKQIGLEPSREIISEEKKALIFGPSILALRELVGIHEITLPPDDELLARIHVINGLDFQKIFVNQYQDYPINTLGITLENGHILIDYDSILDRASKDYPNDENGINNTLLEIGLHELIHSCMSNGWLSPSEGSVLKGGIMRRSGIRINLPRDQLNAAFSDDKLRKAFRYGTGLRFLNEGFTQYLTEIILNKVGSPTSSRFYKSEVEDIIKPLLTQIDEESLFKASFEKNGFKTLSIALINRYGANALRNLALTINADRIRNMSATGYDYRNTKKLS